ncbi:MAG: type II toxin-antitoxin system VapC family toxin [Lentisphaeria bacterium]|nr:type II toxin-antitoxin system VapC family toxin [Lentisphaeria bacterium]
MRAVLDASALAKRYVQEPGSDEVEGILMQTSALGLCVVCMPEIVSALSRLRRERVLSVVQYRQAKHALAVDIGEATVLHLTPSVIARAVALLETNVLRALDSLHVACAIEWGAELFVSADHRQFAAAENAGLPSRFVGRPSGGSER